MSLLIRFLASLITSPTRRGYAATYLGNACIVASTLLSYRLATLCFSESAFTEYAVARRYLSSIIPLLCMGLGVALTRQVAAYAGTKRAEQLLSAALVLTGVALVPLVLVAIVAPHWMAQLLWGDPARGSLVLATLPAIAGTLLNAMAYAYLRGQCHYVQANLLQTVNIGLVPLVTLLFAPTVEVAFVYSGICVLGISLGCLAASLVRVSLPSWIDLKATCGSLLRYGLPRVPGDLTLALLFYLPVGVTAHLYGVTEAGYVAYALTLITLMQVIVGPISTVLLPEVTTLLRNEQLDEVRRRVRTLICGALAVTSVATALAIGCTGLLLQIHLSTFHPDLVGFVRLAACIAVPYNVYVCIRSVLDAASERALNARSIYAAALTAGAFLGLERILFPSAYGPLAAMLSGITMLAGLTIWQVGRVLKTAPVFDVETSPATIPAPHFLKNTHKNPSSR